MPSVQAQTILEWFVLRWQMEVTFHEVRAHSGVETQRQWSDLAILRTTPALLTLSYPSPVKPDMIEIPRFLFRLLTQTLAFAAYYG
ncbi:hypothetical protein ccbrp13_46620 [Ktedonobacteria bacterium brp13]|nr:hypothetical protein ccbrp13_46620 [Ktedonobacteria bacterium brp13]